LGKREFDVHDQRPLPGQTAFLVESVGSPAMPKLTVLEGSELEAEIAALVDEARITNG
jgi:hypothetical protein